MRCRDHRTDNRQQVETAYNAESSFQTLEIQRLRKSLNGVSQKVLTDSLRQLESDGIILRTVYPEVPPRVEYSLTELGESMRPILSAMENWGRSYKDTLL